MTKSVHVGQFRSMPARVFGELSERVEDGQRALKYHLSFVDDYCRAISPNDLVLVGAPTGIGKTELVMNIATTNAMLGKRVHIFALEAEPRELERRTKYALLSQLAHSSKHPRAIEMNFKDWRLGRLEEICEQFNGQVDRVIAKKLASLFTYYRDTVFGAAELRRQILDIHESTDLIVIDHLHYIDLDGDQSETQAVGELVKTIRDVALNVGRPVILVAHLRKSDQSSKRLVPTIGDFHGSSNITKICTHAITIERCHVIDAPDWFMSPTFISVLKDRAQGPCPYVAVTNYDRRKKSYDSTYTLGRLEKNGTEWKPFTGAAEPPHWAINHRAMETA